MDSLYLPWIDLDPSETKPGGHHKSAFQPPPFAHFNLSFACRFLLQPPEFGSKWLGLVETQRTGQKNCLVWGKQTWEWKSRIFRKYIYDHLHSVFLIKFYNDWSTYPPNVPPLRNKRWIRPYWGKPTVHKPLIRPAISGEGTLGG